MKRIIAVLLVVATLVSMSSGLAGCDSSNPTLEMGTWLSLIAESFGMSEYTSEEPYFDQVDSSDAYFGAFQLAAEWEILPPDGDTSSATEVTWKDALITLVNAGEFLPVDAAEEEKIDYAVANFNSDIRTYWMKRAISFNDAIALLDTAADLWVNQTYTQQVEEWDFSDGVTDLIREEDITYEIDGDTIIIDADYVSGLSEGDVYTLPGIAGLAETSINKVSSIEIEGDTAKITNDPSFDEEEVSEYIENIQIQETAALDFSNISAIYDESGNVIYSAADERKATLTGAAGCENSGAYLSNLTNVSENKIVASSTGVFNLSDKKLSREIGGYKVEVSFGTKNKAVNSVALTISKEEKKDSKYRDETEKTYVKVGLDNITFTNDVDYSWGKLHSAKVKLDYKTSITGGVEYSQNNKVGKYLEEGQKTTSRLSTIINGYKTALSNLKKDVYDTKYSDKSIYICRFTLPISGSAISVDFILQGKISVTGKIEVTLSMAGAKGVEYKNGNVRYISSSSPSLDFIAEGKAEVTIAPGVEVRLLSKIHLVTFTLDTGVGAKVKYTNHVIDAEWHELYTGEAVMTADDAKALDDVTYQTSAEDILAIAEAAGATWNNYEPGGTVTVQSRNCIDCEIYPILRISASFPFLEKIVKISGSYDFLKNAPTLKLHYDYPYPLQAGLGENVECIYEFKPWDDSVEVLESIEESEDVDFDADDGTIITSDEIMLSSVRIFLDKNQSTDIRITGLPEKYSLKDIVAESEDPKIAKISVLEGKVYAGTTAGTTLIVFKTSDGKHKAYCAVTVYDEQPDSFVGLGGMSA